MEQNIDPRVNQKLPLQGAGGAREKILAAIKQNQPELTVLPDISFLKGNDEGVVDKYESILTTIGGKVLRINSLDEVKSYVKENYSADKRVVSTITDFSDIAELNQGQPIDPHTLEDIELTIIKAHFAVAENGAIWVTEDIIGQRVLPFICQHLAAVVDVKNIVATMHEAYQLIGGLKYSFGTFIAGPSKTADIEQSLVLGAHGPRSMTVFLLG